MQKKRGTVDLIVPILKTKTRAVSHNFEHLIPEPTGAEDVESPNDRNRCARAVHPTEIDSADPVAAYGWLHLINDRFGEYSSPAGHGRLYS
jgi:hypothetical protein